MGYWQRNGKRFLTDAGGYLLLLAALLTGWLPGPGGIPLALAGLGLLSINNKWAQDLRDYVLKHGGRLIEILFPRNNVVEWAYDTLVVLLLTLSSVLIWQHRAIWQISLAVAGYFTALFIALMNRDRAGVKRRRRKKAAHLEKLHREKHLPEDHDTQKS
jgi:hypothetical protein